MNAATWYADLRRFDWNDLADTETIGHWPVAVRTLVLALLFCLCSGVGFAVLLRGTHAALRLMAEEAAALQSELQAREPLVAALDDERRRLDAAEASFATHMNRLPARTAVPALLDALAALAERSGLRLDELNLREEAARGFYVEQPLSLRLSGGYHALGAFADALAALPQLVTLEDFSIEHVRQEATLRMSLGASIHRAAAEDRDSSAAVRLATAEPSATAPLDKAAALYMAAALRDPFMPYAPNAAPGAGPAPDLGRAREALEAFDLTQLAMSGTLERKGQRWALIRDASGSVTRVGLGARLGRDHGRIVRITRERVEMIELVPDGAGWMERENGLSLQGTAAAPGEAQGAQ